MEYGITQNGFIRKPYEDVLSDNQGKARALFGEDIDLSIYSPVGMFVNLLSYYEEKQWELAEDVYASICLDTAEGASLDRLVALGGFKRENAKKGTVDLKFTRVEEPDLSKRKEIIIPAGYKAMSATGVKYVTLEDGHIPVNSMDVTVTAQCADAGKIGALPAYSITELDASLKIDALASVTNPSATYGAREMETDAELRARYKNNDNIDGSTIKAIANNIRKCDPNVTECYVFENETDSPLNPDGSDPSSTSIPPHSIECLVVGGEKETIARAIYESKPAGIQAFGKTENVIVTDLHGNAHHIGFSTPDFVYIYFTVKMTTDGSPDAATLARIKSDIETNIIKYVGGTDTKTINSETSITEYSGLGIGKDVYSWKAIAVNNDIPGVNNLEIYVSRSENPGPGESSQKVEIKTREIAKTDNVKINFI